jgi:cytochrome c oxidase subunit III
VLPDSPIAVAHHNPELKHHFADMEQQRDASSLGMWLFLATEIMFFGGMFCAYLIYRLWYYPEFAAASSSLDITLGTVNTAVLICSSLTVVLAVRAAQIGRRQAQVIYLALTLVLGLAFLGIKGVEWTSKFKEHHIPGPSFHFEGTVSNHPGQPVDQQRAQIFFSLYFAMTGMHALHMIIGIGIFSYLLYQAWKGRYTPEYHTPLENSGLYWHFVDIVWIYLFPLLYLIDRKK